MVKISYSPEALKDLKNIKENVINEFGDIVAKKVITEITTNIRRLEVFPLSGVNLSKNIDVTTDYYYIFTLKNYVFYRIEQDFIYVVRILNEKQEYMQQLFGTPME
jgi:plasmid stabilization system protein ParE